MSRSGTPSSVRRGRGPEEKVDTTSGYNTGGEEDKPGVATVKDEMSAREKLKEELLRQYEAGKLKADKDPTPTAEEIQKLVRDYSVDGESRSQPRQIPTIEEQRDRAASARRSIVLPRQPAVPLPDVSRPPPGYLRPVATMPIPFYQPQPIYRYEDTIVTRVLHSLMASQTQQQQVHVDLPRLQSPDVLNKVLSWDVGNGDRRNLSEGSRRSVGKSVEERRSRSKGRSGDRARRSKRRRSLSLESVIPVRASPRRKRSRSRSHHDERKSRVESPRSKRHKSVEKLLKRSNQHYISTRREASPLTRTCSMKIEKSSHVKRRYHESHSVGRSPSPRTRRKIVFLSPVRAKKSVREVIMDERDTRLEVDYRVKIRSPGKKRVKDRLGVRKEEFPDIHEVEVYNMDMSKGRCGAVAIIKEFIDSKTGIMELRTSEGGRGAVILFSAEQVWIPDRKHDPNGPPKLLVDSRSSSLGLQTLLPVGQEVLMNARNVQSNMADMQATAVWPKFTEIPHYKIRLSVLDQQLERFYEICKVEKLVPVCINGLAPVGSLNIWSARVRQIVDKDWGIVEIKSVPRDGKREFSFRFFCIFHKSDVWLDDGIHVGEHSFFNEKPLNEIVELLQPVDIVARSIVREKGLGMKKALGSTVEMQAICVSLKPSCIPDGAPRGTRVTGGPGAFGGSNRGETPYMFKRGLEHALNVKLAEYLKVSGKVCHNLDPSLIVKLEEKKEAKKASPESVPEKKIHKLTKSVKPTTVVGTATVDDQNNIVTPTLLAKPKMPPLYEKLSNSTACVKEYCTESVGLLENMTKDWVCLFQVSDCVLAKGGKPQELYPVGTKVQINANLIDSSKKIQYLATCVWNKSENLIFPNVEKEMINGSKINLYNEMNLVVEKKLGSDQPSHLDLKMGIVVKLLDDNFGVIKQDKRMVLFDTCDFWTSNEATAAQSGKTLPSLVSVGDSVLFHAALVQPSSQIPFLATAVWLANPSPFPTGKCPVAIRREKIHGDKIKIYEMVSRCTAVQEHLPEVQMADIQILDSKSASKSKEKAVSKSKVYAQKGFVILSFKLQNSSGLNAAIVEFSSDKKCFAFFLSSQSLESHEKTRICIPKMKVYFNAVPVPSGEFPVTHIATTVSHIYSRLPLSEDMEKIVETAMESLRKIMEKKLPEMSDLNCVKPQIISLDICNKSKSKDPSVIDCFPTGRLVCMFNENAGIMEDHRRELAYFEKSDVNLPSELEVKDIVMVMTRCRDVTIRFQASQVLDGPVRMIVHDGTVAISQNLERYFPEVLVKKAKISMKPSSFSSEKISRAKAAVEFYKSDKILTPDYIIDSGEFTSILVKPKKYGSTSNPNLNIVGTVPEKKQQLTLIVKPSPCKSLAVGVQEKINTVEKCTGKVKTVLNESFGLLEFFNADATASPTYCLFDTFDLYLEGGRTAAQSKLTVANVLALDMEVCFHACEISPGSSVPWLATGVWRPDTATHPKPVPHSRITKEKVAVFKKVGESCSVLVSGTLVPSSEAGQSAKTSVKRGSAGSKESAEKEDYEIKEISVGDGQVDLPEEPRKDYVEEKTEERAVPANADTTIEDGSSSSMEVKKEVVKTLFQCETEGLVSKEPWKQVQVENVDMKHFVAEVENAADDLQGKSPLSWSIVIDEELRKEIANKLERSLSDMDKAVVDDQVEGTAEVHVKEEAIDEAHEADVGVKIEVACKNTNEESQIVTQMKEDDDKTDMVTEEASLILPELLHDQDTRGILHQELSPKFAILSLDNPAGTKALLHCDRMWVTDHPVLGGFGWEVTTAEQGVRVNARRVRGFEEFDYQVTFAHVGVSSFNVEMGEYSYTPELARFKENKDEVEMLDCQLEMFKEKK